MRFSDRELKDDVEPLESQPESGSDEEPSDTEGQAMRWKAGEGTDQPPSDEGDAEGHAYRWKGAPGSDQPPSDEPETEGHVRFSDRELKDDVEPLDSQPESGSDDEPSETEGHGWRS